MKTTDHFITILKMLDISLQLGPIATTSNVSPFTNELCHRVVLPLCADCSCDAVVLQNGQEELNKVGCVRWCDHIQHLIREPFSLIRFVSRFNPFSHSSGSDRDQQLPQ